MLQGRFASDIVAMLAISTAIITNEAFPGVIIVRRFSKDSTWSPA
jgi:hypothetical protein